MSPDRLIYMANQIGKFFQSQGHDKAVPGIAEHIRKFSQSSAMFMVRRRHAFT